MSPSELLIERQVRSQPSLPADLPRAIHNPDARVLDRNVQSRKIVHVALLLLMLGAPTTVTPFHHQPEAQHLKSLAIHKNAGRLPHLWVISGHRTRLTSCPLYPQKRTSGECCRTSALCQ